MEGDVYTMKCMVCNGIVHGSPQKIELSICVDCCEKDTRIGNAFFAARKDAAKMYRCQSTDARRLRHETRRRNCLDDWRIARQQQQRTQRSAGRPSKSREIVLWRVNLSVALSAIERERTLKIFFARDFVAPNAGKVRWREIRARWKALPRVRDILNACPGAHPAAAIDFCVTHPDAGPVEFQELKRKMQAVFRLEGRRILHRLKDSERRALVKTPLEDDYNAFASADPRKLIRGYLLQKVQPSLADKIMRHAKSQTRILYGGEESEIARKLLFFWKDRHRETRRRARVTRALAAVGLPMSDRIWEIQLYIKGEVDLPMRVIIHQVRGLSELRDMYNNSEKLSRKQHRRRSIENKRWEIIQLSFARRKMPGLNWPVGESWKLL